MQLNTTPNVALLERIDHLSNPDTNKLLSVEARQQHAEEGRFVLDGKQMDLQIVVSPHTSGVSAQANVNFETNAPANVIMANVTRSETSAPAVKKDRGARKTASKHAYDSMTGGPKN